MRRPYFRITTGLSVIAATAMLWGCGEQTEEAAAPTATPVTVSTAEFKQSDSAAMPGRIEAWRSAEVRARVAGIVLARHFTEGTEVKAGQKLFTIDPAPFEAELAERQAAEARAQAKLTEAQAAFKRAEQLVGSGAISAQELDRTRSEADSARADLLAAQAAIKTAKLQLSYAHVTAPISGRIGRALVTEGALVGQNETTPLALIQQIDKVYANFNQPVAESLHWQDKTDIALNLTVEGSSETFSGKLLFTDISVDPTSSQLTLRGEFDNPERKLLPGMFVRVKPAATTSQRLVVPSRAVHHDNDKRAFVFVVNANKQAEQRFVSLGHADGNLWEITEGVNAGEQVITGGKVEPGSSVEFNESAPAAK